VCAHLHCVCACACASTCLCLRLHSHSLCTYPPRHLFLSRPTTFAATAWRRCTTITRTRTCSCTSRTAVRTSLALTKTSHQQRLQHQQQTRSNRTETARIGPNQLDAVRHCSMMMRCWPQFIARRPLLGARQVSRVGVDASTIARAAQLRVWPCYRRTRHTAIMGVAGRGAGVCVCDSTGNPHIREHHATTLAHRIPPHTHTAARCIFSHAAQSKIKTLSPSNFEIYTHV
jgi:hypothetical protein